jgi:GTP-binding protein HflX
MELDRRMLATKAKRLENELEKLQRQQRTQRRARNRKDVFSVSLVGYTNAGKSTLFKALTKAGTYAADQLFATLDTTSRKVHLAGAGSIVVSDTVGFIHELPPPLVDAFRATLEEVSEADALLHVVDLAHPTWQSQIRSVMTILGEMPVTPGPILIAFNKIDQANSETLREAQEEYPLAVFISASERLGLETLRYKLGQLVQYVASGQ